MGCLIQICPKKGCKYWNSEEAKQCKKCDTNLSKQTGKIWGIDYYDKDFIRKREKIGPNKEAAKERLRQAESAAAAGRHLKKSPDVKTTFQDLADWYIELPKTKAKKSLDRDKRSLTHLLPFFGKSLLKDINPSLIEEYQQQRLSEPSYRGHSTKPATVNRELALLRTIFRKAIANDKAENYPLKGVEFLKENNERDRVLSQEEYILLLAHSPEYLKPILKVGYLTGMRQGEILNLTWDMVDLKEGFIHLKAEDTKTGEGRSVPLTPELIEMFRGMTRGLPGVKVFTRSGQAISSIREGFEASCKRAGIENFTFHDLRHTFVTNKCKEGHHYFRIMAATGHKTVSVFKRYNTVDREELKTLVGNHGNNGQYLDSD